MLVKVLTLRFDDRLEGFADAPVRDFLKDKEVLAVKDQFFVKTEVPYWSFAVTYRIPPHDGEVPVRGERTAPDGKWDYRAILGDAGWALFNVLGDWRRAKAHAEGLRPYLVVTNDALAHVVKARPRTLTDLGQIYGFGAGKLKRYGGSRGGGGAPMRSRLPRRKLSKPWKAPRRAPRRRCLMASDPTQASSARDTPSGRAESGKPTAVFVHWVDFLGWLLPATEKFPKKARFTFSGRIDALALDILEDIVEAQYVRSKADILRRVNLRLEKLRVPLRISHGQRYMATTAYEHAARRIDEAGRMVGGWLRQKMARPAALTPGAAP